MRYRKKTKYKFSVKKLPTSELRQKDEDISAEELYKEMMRTKMRRRSR